MNTIIERTLNQTLLDIIDEPFVINNRNRNKFPLKIIPYVGCKAGFKEVFDTLIPRLDQNIKIVDVFGGGGAFSFYASNRFGSEKVTYNDNNPIVVNLIKSLRDDPIDLYHLYQNHFKKSSIDYYYEIRKMDLGDGVKGASNFLYLAKNAFSGKIRFNSKNKFNSPMRKGSQCPRLALDSLVYLSKTIKNLTIANKDFRDFKHTQNSFLYLDPPYLNNDNGHYNGTIDLNDFNSFLRSIEKSNMVLLSEQNKPEIFSLSKSNYHVCQVLLKRSLQYFTQKQSKEIIAFNYSLND